MTKRQLIDATARKTGIRERDVRRLFDAFIETAQAALVADERVLLYGFGVLKTIPLTQKMARNPRTGEPQPVKARRRVKFLAAKEIRRFD